MEDPEIQIECQEINDSFEAQRKAPDFRLFPTYLRDILNPNYIKKLSKARLQTKEKKGKNGILEDLLMALDQLSIEEPEIEFSHFSDIIPLFPSLKSPEAKAALVGPRVKDLSIRPYAIIEIIWNRLVEFVKFKDIDPDLIPKEIYSNLFELNPTLVSLNISYRPRFDDFREWIDNLKKWYADTDPHVGWNSLFSVKIQDTIQNIQSFAKRVYEMLLVIITFYYYAYRKYYAQENKDLELFWTLTLEERQPY